MSKLYSYKGYHGSICYSEEDNVYYGTIEFIGALVTYEADKLKDLRKSFEDAVDDHLVWCKESNVPIPVPFRGSFNVRVGSDLHREAVKIAHAQDMKLNQVVKEALQAYVKRHKPKKRTVTTKKP